MIKIRKDEIFHLFKKNVRNETVGYLYTMLKVITDKLSKYH